MATVVTGVPVSALPSADQPLVGDELVLVVQDGTTKQVPVSALATSDEDRIRGRAIGAGTGAVQDLTPAQAASIIANGRATGNLGYLNVPPVLLASDVTLDADDNGTALLLEGASSYTVTIDGALGNGFIVTLVVLDPAGEITIAEADGDTILNLSDGTTGNFILGQGVAALWKANDDTWTIHGTNVTAPQPFEITVTIGFDGTDFYGYDYSGGMYTYGGSSPAAPVDVDGMADLNQVISSYPAFNFFSLFDTSGGSAALTALKAAYTSVEVETAAAGVFETLLMSAATVAGTQMFWTTSAIDWSGLTGSDRIVRFVP